ncbi:hypothetical protein QFZ97_003985 [Paraburkholderia youngii]
MQTQSFYCNELPHIVGDEIVRAPPREFAYTPRCLTARQYRHSHTTSLGMTKYRKEIKSMKKTQIALAILTGAQLGEWRLGL